IAQGRRGAGEGKGDLRRARNRPGHPPQSVSDHSYCVWRGIDHWPAGFGDCGWRVGRRLVGKSEKRKGKSGKAETRKDRSTSLTLWHDKGCRIYIPVAGDVSPLELFPEILLQYRADSRRLLLLLTLAGGGPEDYADSGPEDSGLEHEQNDGGFFMICRPG